MRTAPPRSKRGLFVRLGILSLVFGALLVVWLRDEAPSDDSDLVPPSPESIPDSDNALSALIAAEALVVTPPGWVHLADRDPGALIVDETIASAMAANRSYFSAVDAALARPRCRVAPVRSIGDGMDHIEPLRICADWNSDRVRWRLHRGEIAEAVEVWDRWAGALSDLASEPAALIDSLFQRARFLDLMDEARLLAESPGIESSHLARLQARLAGFPDPFDVFPTLLRREYILMSQSLTEGIEELGLDTLMYKPNATRRKYAEQVRRQVRAFEERDLSLLDTQYEPPSTIRTLLGGNYTGESLLSILASVNTGMYRSTQRHVETWILHRVALAIRRFEVDHGRWPETIDGLVPTALEPGVLERLDLPIILDRDARWVGFDRPADLEPTAAPGIGVGSSSDEL
ncbi:MAG: hypothetical protein KDC38_06410 [Planctomycetes bacterium]|nr:hypothetical protein [Planctomycetota bacterium]